MQPCKLLVLASGTVVTILLSACGGGSSAVNNPVTGTAASGRPVAGQTVQALDSAGLICATATTASDGTYSVDTSGCVPGAVAFYVAAYTTPSGAPLEAVAVPPQGTNVVKGVVNINPLTTLLAYYAAGLVATANPPTNNAQVLALLPQITAAQYQQAMTGVLTAPLLHTLQAGYGVTTTGFDPTSAPFVANGQGVDGFFDAYPFSASGTSVQVAASSSPGPLVQVTLPTTAGGNSTVTSISAYAIGGNVSGLASGSLTLLMNGTGPFNVTANGAFIFPTQVSSTYAVTVGAQPVGQVCTVSNGSGSGVTANVSNVSITCSAKTYTIGGTVTGLAAGSQVTLNDNGADPATVTASGAFTFATPVAYNSGYAVTVGTQPTGQTCTVSGGSGSGVTANVSTVSVTCSTNTYTIGGSVTGLASGTQVTLRNNGADPAVVTANTTFTFATPVAYNGSYAVTVGTQPNGESCTVSNGSGSGVAANISSVSVACAANPIFVYVGNYGSNNVLGYRLNPLTGATNNIPGAPFPAGTYDRWVTANPAGTFAYAVNQNSNNVSAYSVNAATGTLTAVPGSPFATGGSVPVFITVNATGTFAYVANSASGDVTVFSIDPTTGALSTVAGSPFAAGTVPISIAINPAGTFAYVANKNSNDISAYAIDPTTGALTPVPGSPFANSAGFGSIQSITVNAAGTFAYGANGWGPVSGFSIDPTSGALTAVPGSPFVSTAGGGQWVEINPAGTFAYLATGNGGYVLTFSIDATSGALTQITGGSCGAHSGVPGVNYIKINSAGTYAYMANGLVLNVSVCSIDPSSGALTDVPGSPFGVGARPLGIGVVQH
jgi:6-phosphogluconolactonase (cycloisomerase 2 family)